MYFELRIRKLGIYVYHYLHEKCLIYQTIKDEVETRINKGEEIEPEDWMDGQWFPTQKQIDPASYNDVRSQSIFFPLTGNYQLYTFYIDLTSQHLQDIIQDLRHICEYKEKNKIRSMTEKGNSPTILLVPLTYVPSPLCLLPFTFVIHLNPYPPHLQVLSPTFILCQTPSFIYFLLHPTPPLSPLLFFLSPFHSTPISTSFLPFSIPLYPYLYFILSLLHPLKKLGKKIEKKTPPKKIIFFFFFFGGVFF